MTRLASAFDVMAADYDRVFTASDIGRRLRDATWRRFDRVFRPGERVLELNCGTGEDAIHLAQLGVRVVATDVSASMLDVTRAKVERAGLSGQVDIAQLRIEDMAGFPGQSAFDGAVSNFGGLNCLADLPSFASALAGKLKPRARALFCVMGPAVPWEWAWFLARGEARKAFRRLRPGGTAWRGMTIYYPTIGAVRRAFAPHFRQLRVSAVGALIPPPYARDWIGRHPGILATLDRWERRLETVPPLPWLADHYLLELERFP